MAEIKKIDMSNGGMDVTLTVSREEYKILQHHVADIVVLPAGSESLTHQLTTGKLGNSNRVMLPKKLLGSFKLSEPEKKVPSNIFMLNDDAYLLIKIKSSKQGIPKFAVD